MTFVNRGRVLRRRAARLLVVQSVLCGVLAYPSAAQEVLYGGNDWYVTASGVLAVDSSDANGAKPGGGANVGAGFRINRWLSTELGAEWIDQIRYDRGSGASSCRGTGGHSNGYTAWQVTAGGRLYATQSLVQPFLLGHGGFINTRDHGGGRSCSGTGFVARLGGGIDVFVNNALAISLIGAYVLPTAGGAEDHDYVSIGLGIIWY